MTDQACDARDDSFRALARAPDQAAAWSDLGRSLKANDRHAEALAAFREAFRLSTDPLVLAGDVAAAAIAADQVETEIARRHAMPDTPGDLLVMSRLLRHLGRLDEALAAAEKAAPLAPLSSEIAAEQALSLVEIAQDARAEAALRHALELDPAAATLRYKLGRVLLRLGRPSEARDAFVACLDENSPPEILVDLALAELQLGRQDEARTHCETAIHNGADREAKRLLATILAYTDGVSGAELTDALQQSGESWRRAKNPSLYIDPAPNRRLRLGLLGGGLWRHPSTWLTVRGIEALDRDKFELHCFTPELVTDAFSARWKHLAAGWHVTRGKSDDDVARMIRSARIDILIDLGGYLNHGRMTVMAQRPAPVQIKWVGAQFHTSGFPEIDAFVTDVHETPPDLGRLYSEKLLVLPDSYVCYDPPGSAPDIGPLPSERNGYVTFGSFNNLMKITPATLDAWAAILRGVGDARLHIHAPQMDEEDCRHRLIEAFVSRGVGSTRVEVFGSTDHMSMLSAYNQIDIALQPFPYCGGVTLLEGLVMGVPSVAWCGETFASRHGLTHLTNVGLADFVSTSKDAYVATAIAKASDHWYLSDLRARLRDQLAEGPICDARTFGPALGEKLLSI